MANATDPVTVTIQRAVDLAEQKGELYDAIASNRRWLRDSDKNGLLSAEQSAWLKEHYPPKAAKGSAEVAAE